MLKNILLFAEAASGTVANLVFGIRLALIALVLICTVFCIVVVLKQSGNTDEVSAITGSSSKQDESETYYGKNAGSRKEARLKLWTYIALGVIAVSCIVLICLQLLP